MTDADVTTERRVALVAELEAYIERYLDKQWIISDAIGYTANTEAERRFLQSVDYEFKGHWK